ncbi:MAG: rRNA maturation RNase YbeY [Pyrinomonadaceae bacterium]
MITDIVNLQRKVTIAVDDLRPFVDKCSSIEEASGSTFSIAFISDDRMKQLNEMFRGKKSTTDVLSFPHEPDEFDPDKNNLGDIVISAQQAEKQAAENGLTLDGEIRQLILHGVLHLCGYDHETDNGEMNAREMELRIKLKV